MDGGMPSLKGVGSRDKVFACEQKVVGGAFLEVIWHLIHQRPTWTIPRELFLEIAPKQRLCDIAHSVVLRLPDQYLVHDSVAYIGEDGEDGDDSDDGNDGR